MEQQLRQQQSITFLAGEIEGGWKAQNAGVDGARPSLSNVDRRARGCLLEACPSEGRLAMGDGDRRSPATDDSR